jgi:hypothetical protein
VDQQRGDPTSATADFYLAAAAIMALSATPWTRSLAETLSAVDLSAYPLASHPGPVGTYVYRVARTGDKQPVFGTPTPSLTLLTVGYGKDWLF